MQILLTNDDGYRSEGLNAMYQVLSVLPNITVKVVAPERNCSGASNSLTLSRPLSVEKAPNGFMFVNGTPTDCVHVALTGLLDSKPDLVLSGINDGPNMGKDTLYSGTVAAAMEGYLFDIPSIAFSLSEASWQGLERAVCVAKLLVEKCISSPLLPKALLNVNIPSSVSMPPVMKSTRLGRRHCSQGVICQKDPRGRTIYWIGEAGGADDGVEGTDFHAVANGQVSVSCLQLDLSNPNRQDEIANWLS